MSVKHSSRVKQALNPGGHLIVVDYLKPELRNHLRRDQGREHNIAPAFVEHDLKDAGFTQSSAATPIAPGMMRSPLISSWR